MKKHGHSPAREKPSEKDKTTIIPDCVKLRVEVQYLVSQPESSLRVFFGVFLLARHEKCRGGESIAISVTKIGYETNLV